MKQKLIALSKEKGFKSEQILFDSIDGLTDKRYYLWMCELKLWLLEGSDLFCSGDPVNHLEEFRAAVEYDNLLDLTTVYDSITTEKGVELFDKYTLALEKALYEGLKLTEK